MLNKSAEAMFEGVQRSAYLFFTPYMYFDSPEHYSSSLYPLFPTVPMGIGLGVGVIDISEIQIILGYYDNPPRQNETAQLNGQ